MSDSVKRKAGRHPFEPTREQRQMVQALRAHGVSQKTMAQNIRGPDQPGIDVKTLRKVFAGELRDGFDQVKAAIGAAVVKSALSGSVAAQKYWLGCWGGPEWKPPQAAEMPGTANPGGTTIIIRGGMSAAIDAKTESDEEPDDGSDEPA